MAEVSRIEWTTFNPWWGCAHVSAGCAHCYAEALARRYGRDVWGATGTRRLFGEAQWAGPLAWNRKAESQGRRLRVFCASMADVFEDHPALRAERDKLWDLIGKTPTLDWQLLTKRPENVTAMVPWAASWPVKVWLGVSVENQKWAGRRIPPLLEIPAAVRFLSCEPLLGPLDPSAWLAPVSLPWIIVGGEAGPRARPMDLARVRSLRDQCLRAKVAFFFKQWGGRTAKARGRMLDGRTWDEMYGSRERDPVDQPASAVQ